MKHSATESLRADLSALLKRHGPRSVLSILSGEIFDLHLESVHDNPMKWLFKKWADRLETMAEENPKQVEE